MLKIVGIITIIILQQFNIWGITQDWILDKLELNKPIQIQMINIKPIETTIQRPPIKQSTKNIKPYIKAKSAIAIDQKSGQILFEQNANQKLPIASITKLMTALVVVNNNSLKDKVVVNKKDTLIKEGVKMWLYPGEEITIANLLKGLLINSAADAAKTLARHTAGNEEKFVKLMNQEAKKLGLENTYFVNPTGLDNKDEDNYSTAKELSDLSRIILKNEFIRKTVAIEKTVVRSTDGNIDHELENTNDLLSSYLDVRGLKTGYTERAGECLVTLAKGGNKSSEVVTVVLDSPDRFQESKVVTDWVFRNFKW